jgi:hypothetical protein
MCTMTNIPKGYAGASRPLPTLLRGPSRDNGGPVTLATACKTEGRKMRGNVIRLRLQSKWSIVGAASLYLAMSAAAPGASAQAYYYGAGECVKYCNNDSGSREDYGDNSAPARLGRNINRAVRGLIDGFVSGVASILQPPQQQPPQRNAFFGTGGTSSGPAVEMPHRSTSVTAYASVGSQLNTASGDPSGCVFDGSDGCREGAVIDYKIGTIGSMTFRYPVITHGVYDQMSATDKQALAQLIKQRYAAEVDLPLAQRAYAEAKENGAAQWQVADLEERMQKDGNKIDNSNKQIKKMIDRVVLD